MDNLLQAKATVMKNKNFFLMFLTLEMLKLCAC